MASDFLEAQATFNKRFHFDYLAAVGTSVLPFDDGYYFTGVLVDTVSPYEDGGFFAIMDLDGNPVAAKTWISNEYGMGPWFNTLAQLKDSTFALTAVHIDSTEKTFFLKLDKTGDTLFTKKFINPSFPDFSFMQPRGGMTALPDGGFVISNWYTDHKTGDYPSSDIYIFKISDSGDTLWENFFHSPNTDRASSLVADGSGNVILGWLNTNFNLVFEDFTSQIKLAKLDGQGEVVWEYTTPEFIGLRDAPNDMVLLDDGSLIIASGVGTEIERPTSNTIWYEKLLFRLSPAGAIMWEAVFPNPGPQNSQGKLTNVIEVSDGSGFVTAGMEGEDLGGYLTFEVRG